MIVSLYAGLSEFALPTPAKKEGEEDKHEAKSSSKSLFERVTAEHASDKGKPAAHDGDAAVIADKARWAALTADVPASGVSDNLAGGNLTDGYRLHNLSVENAGAQDQCFQNSGMAEVAPANSSSITAAGILPNIELDYSSEGVAAQSLVASASKSRSTVV
jgi:hypothetical protein